MTGENVHREGDFGPWHPGLTSAIPHRLLPQVTLYQDASSSIDYEAASELSDFCGIKAEALVRFRPGRLVLHEVLIQISADYYIPDGKNYEDFGLNLRGMAATVIDAHIAPHSDTIEAEFDTLARTIRGYLTSQVDRYLTAPPTANQAVPAPDSWWRKLTGRPAQPTAAPPPTTPPEFAALDRWRQQQKTAEEPWQRTSLEALARVVSAVVGHRSRLVGDPSVLIDIAQGMAMNELGSQLIGELVKPYVTTAAAAEGFERVPAQQKPVVMNVKGASAAGKSTIRPQQKRLAAKLAIPWKEFAVISPDYWRKFLLDYDSLGADYKYAAMLTGQELEIIDQKLDRYMAAKAREEDFPNLIIDRFRFDSFVSEADSRLLTRFGDTVFMMFVITAPQATVERAWSRGLATGRYKPVDDLLFHNVEACTGIPQLYFSWASSKSKRVHFEFLDNNVPPDAAPKTIAFGWNNALTILDIKPLIDLSRGRHLNIDAQSPDDVFNDVAMEAADHTQFLTDCATHIHQITFADQSNGQVYAVMTEGEWTWCDADHIERMDPLSDAYIGLQALGIATALSRSFEPVTASLELEKAYTLGAWLQPIE